MPRLQSPNKLVAPNAKAGRKLDYSGRRSQLLPDSRDRRDAGAQNRGGPYHAIKTRARTDGGVARATFARLPPAYCEHFLGKYDLGHKALEIEAGANTRTFRSGRSSGLDLTRSGAVLKRARSGSAASALWFHADGYGIAPRVLFNREPRQLGLSGVHTGNLPWAAVRCTVRLIPSLPNRCNPKKACTATPQYDLSGHQFARHLNVN